MGYFGKSLIDIQETLKQVIGDETDKQFGTQVSDEGTREDSGNEDTED